VKRLTVCLIVVAATLAIEAAAFFSVFAVRKVGDDGYALLYARQAAECDEAGPCLVWSTREIAAKVFKILQDLKQSGADI